MDKQNPQPIVTDSQTLMRAYEAVTGIVRAQPGFVGIQACPRAGIVVYREPGRPDIEGFTTHGVPVSFSTNTPPFFR